jgi:hypothetical protein
MLERRSHFLHSILVGGACIRWTFQTFFFQIECENLGFHQHSHFNYYHSVTFSAVFLLFVFVFAGSLTRRSSCFHRLYLQSFPYYLFTSSVLAWRGGSEMTRTQTTKTAISGKARAFWWLLFFPKPFRRLCAKRSLVHTVSFCVFYLPLCFSSNLTLLIYRSIPYLSPLLRHSMFFFCFICSIYVDVFQMFLLSDCMWSFLSQPCYCESLHLYLNYWLMMASSSSREINNEEWRRMQRNKETRMSYNAIQQVEHGEIKRSKK